jgi:hypothetical protein
MFGCVSRNGGDVVQPSSEADLVRGGVQPSSEADLARGGVRVCRGGHQGCDRLVCAFFRLVN